MQFLLFLLMYLTRVCVFGQSADVVYDVGVTSPPINQAGSVAVGQPIPDWSEVVLDGKLRYVELVLVVDAPTARYYDNNMEKIRSAMIGLIHGVNLFLFQLDIRLLVVDVRKINGHNVSLDQFSKWRQEEAELPPHDLAMLMRFRYDGGIAYVNGVCKRNAAGIAGFYPEAPFEYATVFVHELSHLLGMSHDLTAECRCSRRKHSCLKIDGFERECSVQALVNIIQTQPCIQESPKYLPYTLMPVCGNGILEDNEQCDCGPSRHCRNLLCDPHSCKYLISQPFLYAIAAILCTILAILFICIIRSISSAMMRNVSSSKPIGDPFSSPTVQALVSSESSLMSTPGEKTPSSNDSLLGSCRNCSQPLPFISTPVTRRQKYSLDSEVPLVHGGGVSTFSDYVPMHPPKGLSLTPNGSPMLGVKDIRLPPLQAANFLCQADAAELGLSGSERRPSRVSRGRCFLPELRASRDSLLRETGKSSLLPLSSENLFNIKTPSSRAQLATSTTEVSL